MGFKSRRIGRREAVEYSVGWDGGFIQLVETAGLLITPVHKGGVHCTSWEIPINSVHLNTSHGKRKHAKKKKNEG